MGSGARSYRPSSPPRAAPKSWADSTDKPVLPNSVNRAPAQPEPVEGARTQLGASPKRKREMELRAALSEARTVVVKVGSSSLTTNARLNDEKIARAGERGLA